MKHKRHKPAETADLLQWGVPRLIGAGYGLFSRKAADPRWPEFLITAFVLRKYRERSSFWFMVKSAVSGIRRHQKLSGELQAVIARLIGSTPRQMYQLSGIYQALQKEKGAAVATAATVEIVRITNQKRQQRLVWWRPPKPGQAVKTAPAKKYHHKPKSKKPKQAGKK